jgi:release factor glutamine methyltransferase
MYLDRPVRVAEAATAAARLLRLAKIETPELDARVLICHAAGLEHEALVASPDAALPADAASRFGAYLQRRLKGEPVSRILGVREFYGRAFRIDENTLDPRPDTETLIDAALAIVDRKGSRDASLEILDLGTGSGAILLTLLAELPRATGIGADISLAALKLAKANAEALGVGGRAGFVAADWFTGIGGAFDLVGANPPYLATAAIESLPIEVCSHDPLQALDGGADGLAAYRRIAAVARTSLKPGGSLLVEIGADQAEAVVSLFGDAGLDADTGHCLWRDLNGLPRAVVGHA